MGMGTDNVYLINTNANGKMDAGHLGNWFGLDSQFNSIKSVFRFIESEILRAQTEGALPFMVSATAGNETSFTLCTRWWITTLWMTICRPTGTTVLGAFDPLDKIADLCDKYKMWMHVDAAWGGQLIS